MMDIQTRNAVSPPIVLGEYQTVSRLLSGDLFRPDSIKYSLVLFALCNY
jgi:hypothetical protein